MCLTGFNSLSKRRHQTYDKVDKKEDGGSKVLVAIKVNKFPF